MSAILGRIELCARPVETDGFLKAFGILAAYGPDSSDHWIEGSVAAGRRLMRISAAAANERAPELRNGLVVVADAILDDRLALGERLGLAPPDVARLSDTDLIERSYLRWGEACVDHLLGDFAFAVINPSRRSVFLARDHIGARPLYWALRDRTFLFGTSIEAIVAVRDFNWPIDERIVAEYLVSPFDHVSKPFFVHANAVGAGATLSLSDGRVTSTRWWRPSLKQRARSSDEEAVATCRALLEQSVRDRIDTPRSIGSHLSGGIDSTGLTVIASRQLRASGRSLARGYAWSPAGFDEQPADERINIASLAQAEGIPLRLGEGDIANFIAFMGRPLEFEGVADLADEVPVLRAAEQDRVSVILSGWGGDEAFSAHGYGYLADLLRRGRFGAARRYAHTFANSLKRPDVLKRLLWRELLLILMPEPLFRRFGPYRGYFPRKSFMSPELSNRHADLVSRRHPGIKLGPNARENLQRLVMAGHLTMRMESWAAWGAPHGVQYRYPLTDKRLLEFLFALPSDQIFMGQQTRGLARTVLADCVPGWAGKSDFVNERARRNAREAGWRHLAQCVADGAFDDACPWLDMSALREYARRPSEQTSKDNILAFVELFAAARVLNLHRRATAKGWA